MSRRSRAPRFLSDRQAAVLVGVATVAVWGLLAADLVLPFVDPGAETVVVAVSFVATLAYAVWRVGRLVLTRGRADRATPALRRARRQDAKARARQEDFDRRHPPTDDPYQHGGPPTD